MAPSVWDKLPHFLKTIDNVNTYKQKHFFQRMNDEENNIELSHILCPTYQQMIMSWFNIFLFFLFCGALDLLCLKSKIHKGSDSLSSLMGMTISPTCMHFSWTEGFKMMLQYQWHIHKYQ